MVPEHLRVMALHIRRRFVAVNAATVLALAGLDLILPDALATPMAGPVTFGMALLGLYGVILIGSAVWYDRAFAARCDRPAGDLVGVREER
ncbi:hypothetical protein [Streptomyces sp. Inha503]|uniref:hypothetical protein n=1 Tax=Streptomyces sp. Inha503 TaxID=3383314 RepID=UPI0039A10B09